MADTPFFPSSKPKEEEPKVETKVEDTKVETPELSVEDRKAELLAQVQKALEDHGNMESNIGNAHPYWGWLNEYRRLLHT